MDRAEDDAIFEDSGDKDELDTGNIQFDVMKKCDYALLESSDSDLYSKEFFFF